MNDIDLTQFDDAYKEAEVQESNFDPIPDGKYQVMVDRVQLKRSRTSNNPMLEWTLRVIAPRFVGRLLWRRNMIVTDENIRWLKTDLEMCGLTLQKLSHLPARLGELLDLTLEVTKSTNGEFENVYFNSRIQLQGDAQKAETSGEEHLPF